MGMRQHECTTDKGYGVVLAGLQSKIWKPNAAVTLVDSILTSGCDSLKAEFEEYCADNEYSPEDEVGKREFVEDYEVEDGIYDGGIGGLMAVFLNEEACKGHQFFCFMDSCLYVTACVPVDSESRVLIPTQENISRLFGRYLNPLLVEPLEINWVYPSYC